ncbi:MAG: hypothetical protein L0Z62_00130 [Gemmataceae bacterium]|nr:hypothetical protein [Gemmataceae bacterium]
MPILLALCLLGIIVLLSTLRSAPRSASHTPLCLERYTQVVVLLQAGQKLEALAQAALIHCEHVRAEAIKLVERSRPFTPKVSAGDSASLASCDTVVGSLIDQMTTHLDRHPASVNGCCAR